MEAEVQARHHGQGDSHDDNSRRHPKGQAEGGGAHLDDARLASGEGSQSGLQEDRAEKVYGYYRVLAMRVGDLTGIHYDEEEDVLGIQLKSRGYWRSVEVSENVVVDLTKKGEIIGIEIHGARRSLKDVVPLLVPKAPGSQR